MEFIWQYLSSHRKTAGVFLLFVLVFWVVFELYHFPVAAILYPLLVCACLGLVLLALDLYQAYKRHRKLQLLEQTPAYLMQNFPAPRNQDEADYQQIIQSLCTQQRQLQDQLNLRYQEMMDYYTVWVHQIKTPIASMRLNLQNEDTDEARLLSEDLQRIEQYVEMVLCYLRLDANSTDYVFRSVPLDGVIKPVVRKFANQFIRKKLRLVYEISQVEVLTDEKWLAFVVEQILSNAVKYTPEGGTITLDVQSPKTLCIRDTGIGIAPQDLPRVFEQGYTGYNGRSDKRASGIGLYLCHRICNNLGHRLSINSSLDSGTVVQICLDQKKLQVE